MCISKTSLKGALGEAAFADEILAKATIYFDEYSIVPLKVYVEGMPYDHTVTIGRKAPDGTITDEKILKVQVKTTTQVRKGKLFFNTVHNNGNPYTEDEVSFLVLCYRNPRTGERWFGLTLPSECTTKTVVAYQVRPTAAEKDLDRYDFSTRFNELLETGTITPIVQGPEEPVDILPDDEFVDTPDLEDDNTFITLMARYDYKLDDMARGLHMDPKVFRKYHRDYVNRIMTTPA